MYFILVLTLFTAWITLFPLEALNLITTLKRRLRSRIIQRDGNQGAKELACQLHDWADQNGIDSKIVDEVLNKHWDQICQQLGSAAANAILGKPTIFEK